VFVDQARYVIFPCLRNKKHVEGNMVNRSTIIAQFEQVAREHGKKLAPMSDDLVLLESGLDSLCMAIIVARLEDSLGLDPFSAGEDVELPVTVGDFIRLYVHAAR
jgi:acyl carrier protein